MILKTRTFVEDRFLFLLSLFVGMAFLHPTFAQTQPTATNATEIGSTTFKANWNAVPNATSYRLDVSTTPFEALDIAGWTFPTAAATNNIGSTNNNINSRALSSNSSFTVSGGQASRKGWNIATNTDYW